MRQKVLRIILLLVGAGALLAGCGQDVWLYEPGIVRVRFDSTVGTEAKAREIVDRHRRAELLWVLIFDGAGALSNVRVPQGREWRFIEKFESEEEVIYVSPVLFVPVGATGGS